MFDVLLYVFENYLPDGRPGPAALARKLTAVGFDREAITRALRWLEGLDGAGGTGFLTQPHPQAQRLFDDEELARIPPDCRGLLAFLEQAGAIDPLTRELIIDRAMAVDSPGDSGLPLDQFKVIVLMAMWRRQLPFDHLVFEDFLEDDDERGRLPMH